MRLPSDMRRWTPEAREFFEERAAIREWLGKMPRDEAERLAEEDARRWWSAGLSREERKGRDWPNSGHLVAGGVTPTRHRA